MEFIEGEEKGKREGEGFAELIGQGGMGWAVVMVGRMAWFSDAVVMAGQY
jgi:hypothetical protein